MKRTEGLTLLSDNELAFLKRSLLRTKDIKGNIVMAGVWNGGDVAELGMLIKNRGMQKRIIVIDSFNGLAEAHKKDRPVKYKSYKGLLSCGGLKKFISNIAKFNVLDICDIYEMWIDKKTIKQVPKQQISFIWLDLDHYIPTAACLKYFYSMLEPGGIIVLHDLGPGPYDYCSLPGVRTAAKEISNKWRYSTEHRAIGYLVKELNDDSKSS